MKDMKRKSGVRGYLYAMGVLIVLIILGQLLWIPDPIRLFGHVYWIDLLQGFIYITIILPLMWLIISLYRTTSKILITMQIMTIAFSICTIALLIYDVRQIIGLAVCFGMAWLSVTAQLIYREVIARRTMPWRSVSITGASLVIIAVLLWPTNYLVTYPGITMNMDAYASVENGNSRNEISGVLIFERPAFPIDWLYAVIFPTYSFEKQEKLGMSLGEYDHMVRVMKEDANMVASAVAFQMAGLGQGVYPDGVWIMGITEGSPAAGILQAGDIIVQVNGREVKSAQELSEQFDLIAPGDAVDLEVNRNGISLTIQAPTAEHPDVAKRAALGIQIMNHLQYDIPQAVTFHQYLLHEGGPSHGAMLTLAIIDQLTEGGVTNGNKVAGTGTIESDGSIGKIGGIEQKAFTVARTDADVFFVPSGQEEEARKGSSTLTIVPVHSIEEILMWLEKHPGSQHS